METSELDKDRLRREFEAANQYYQRGNFAASKSAFLDLIRHHPKVPELHFNLALTYSALGEWAEAEGSFRSAVELSPSYAPAQLGLGNVYNQIGDFDRALQHFSIALTSPASRVVALFGSGVALYGKKEFEAALTKFREVLELDSNYRTARYNIADCLRKLGRSSDAEQAYRECLKHYPDYFEAKCWLAKILFDQGRINEALENFKQARLLRPEADLLIPAVREAVSVFIEEPVSKQENPAQNLSEIQALYKRGSIATIREDFEEAERCFRQVVLQSPNSVDAYVMLGSTLVAMNDFEQAEIIYKKALAIDPTHLEALNRLGVICSQLDRPEESERYFKRALSYKPGLQTALNNLAGLEFDRRNPEYAVELYNQILEADSDNHSTKWNRALMNLLNGNYEQGWKDFEARLRTRPEGRNLSKFRWDGSDPKGKTIFVHMEQGIGDRIMFSRYVPKLVERGATVLLECAKPLKPLFSCLKNVTLVDPEEPPEYHDYHVSLLSLPALFGTTLETVPNTVPYLSAPTDHHEFTRRIGLLQISGPKIGFTFKGSRYQSNNRHRSCPISELEPLFNVLGVKWVCLQKELNSEERRFLAERPYIMTLSEHLTDFGATASVVEELDLVISVDTSVAHLAGALGKPVWILLSQNASWQWLLDRADSPWYPTAKLFRQKTLDCWYEPVEQIKKQLAKLFADVTLIDDVPRAQLLEVGRQYLNVGNLIAARAIANQLAEIDRRDLSALFLEAECLRRENQLQKATERIQRCLVLEPNNPCFLECLARIYKAQGEHELAKAAALRAVAAAPAEPILEALFLETLLDIGDRQSAFERGGLAVEKFPTSLELLLSVAKLASSLAKYEDAEHLLSRALTLNPNDPFVHLAMAELLVATNSPKNALLSVDRAIWEGSHKFEVLLSAARIAERANASELALSLYEQALVLKASSTEALIGSANILQSQGKFDEALECYLSAVQIQPRNRDLHCKILQAFKALGQEREAKETLLQLRFLEPNYDQGSVGLDGRGPLERGSYG